MNFRIFPTSAAVFALAAGAFAPAFAAQYFTAEPQRLGVQVFAEAAERALYRWKFPPATAAAGEPRVFCAVSKFLVS